MIAFSLTSTTTSVSFRLKQLYEKFDDVIASGRMIANASDSIDDGKK